MDFMEEHDFNHHFPPPPPPPPPPPIPDGGIDVFNINNDINNNNNNSNVDNSEADAELEKFLQSSTSSSSYAITSSSNIQHTHTFRLANFSLIPINKNQPVESLQFTVGPAILVMRCFTSGRNHEPNERASVFIQLVGIKDTDNIIHSQQSTNNINNNNTTNNNNNNTTNNNNTNSNTNSHSKSKIPSSKKSSRSTNSNNSSNNQNNNTNNNNSEPATPGLVTSDSELSIPTSGNGSLNDRYGSHLTIRYRIRFVYPSGDRSRDEIIPALNKPAYCYQFYINDEHEGSYVTKPALLSRGFLRNDTLIVQAEIEILMKPVTMLSFSHSLPIKTGNSSINIMGKQFKDMWEKEEQCDVRFRLTNENHSNRGRSSSTINNSDIFNKNNSKSLDDNSDDTIPAHKFILSSRSVVFSAMFRHTMQESTNSVIELNDIDRVTLLRLLYHFYTGELPIADDSTVNSTDPNRNDFHHESLGYLTAVSSKSQVISPVHLMPNSYNITPLTTWLDAVKLYQAAVKYSVDYLCELCAWKISQTISTSNVLMSLQLAEYHRVNHGAETIRIGAKNYFLRNFDAVIAASIDQNSHKQFFESFLRIQQPLTNALYSNNSNINTSIIGLKIVESLDPSENELQELSSVRILSSNENKEAEEEYIVIATGQLLKWKGAIFNVSCPINHAAVLIQSVESSNTGGYQSINLSYSDAAVKLEQLTVAKMYFIPHVLIQALPESIEEKIESHDTNMNERTNNSGSSVAKNSKLKRSLASEDLHSKHSNSNNNISDTSDNNNEITSQNHNNESQQYTPVTSKRRKRS